MGIELPPIIAPQLSTVDDIRARIAVKDGGNIIQASMKGYKVSVTGNRHLSAEEVTNILENAASPSKGIHALNRAYYQAGHLLVTVYYAAIEDKLFVNVINGTLAELDAPPQIAGYFENLVGDTDLTIAEFSRNRIIADVKSRRSNVNYSVSYRLRSNPQDITLILTPVATAAAKPTALDISIDNAGNRFTGRYLADAKLSRNFHAGTRASMAYRQAVPEWGSSNGGKKYKAAALILNHPFTFGLFNIEVQEVHYEREVIVDSVLFDGGLSLLGIPIIPAAQTEVSRQFDISGSIRSVKLGGEWPLVSGLGHRTTLSVALRRTELGVVASEAANAEESLVEERYNVFTLGLNHKHSLPRLGKSARIVLSALADKGFGGDSGSFSTSTQMGEVSGGRRSAGFERLLVSTELTAPLPNSDWSVSALLRGQGGSSAQLPQQEQFVLGGKHSLSAWLPAALVGDSGAFFRTVLRSPGKNFMSANWRLGLFAEAGLARFSDAKFAVAGELARSRKISDAGIRISAQWGDVASMHWIVARTLSKENISDEISRASKADFLWQLKFSI